MTLASLRRPAPATPYERLVVAGTLGAAALVGAAIAFSPPAGLALLVAAVCVPLVLADPPVGIALWVVAAFLTRFAPLAPLAGTVLIAVTALGGWRRERLRRDAHGPLLAVVGGLLAWLTLSLAWAQDPSRGIHALPDWYRTGVALVAIAIVVRTPRDVRVVLYGFLVGAVLSVLVGVVHDGVGGGGGASGAAAVNDSAAALSQGRLVGGVGDPNFLAAGIVAALAATPALAAVAGPVRRALIAPAVGLLVAGLGATQSRGGLVAAVVALLAATVFMPGRRGKVALAALAAVVFAAAYFAVFPAALERVTASTPEGNGRTELWRVAWRMSEDHPLLGVGLANFRTRAPGYVYEPGTLRYADLIADRPHAAHNTVLESLAETGVVGVTLFLGAVVTGLVSAAAAARRLRRQGRRQLAVLAESVLVASIAMFTASLFVSSGPEPKPWVLLSLGVAMLSIARSGEPRDAAARRR